MYIHASHIESQSTSHCTHVRQVSFPYDEGGLA